VVAPGTVGADQCVCPGRAHWSAPTDSPVMILSGETQGGVEAHGSADFELRAGHRSTAGRDAGPTDQAEVMAPVKSPNL
jgi:hypothetical protein